MLPYFDYSQSLVIYFPKLTMINCFEFSPDLKDDIWEENDEKITQDIGDKLKSYSL